MPSPKEVLEEVRSVIVKAAHMVVEPLQSFFATLEKFLIKEMTPRQADTFLKGQLEQEAKGVDQQLQKAYAVNHQLRKGNLNDNKNDHTPLQPK